MWAAVTLFGYGALDPFRLVVTVVLLMAGLVSVLYGSLHLHGFAAAAAACVPAVIGLIAPWDPVKAAAVGTYAVVPALVVGFITAVASALLWLIPSGLWWTVWRGLHSITFHAVPSPGPPPIFGPTALRQRSGG
ncbi:MAG: hypothetical protein QOK28_2447 [Actinomycetota bacterium]